MERNMRLLSLNRNRGVWRLTFTGWIAALSQLGRTFLPRGSFLRLLCTQERVCISLTIVP